MIIFFISILLSSSFVCFMCYEGIAELCSFIVFIVSIALCINLILKQDYRKKALLLAMGGLLVGYMSLAISLNGTEYYEKADQIISVNISKENTAVVLLTEGEPEKYNIPLCIKKIKNSYDEHKTARLIKVPFELYNMKNYYRNSHITNSSDITENIIDKLQQSGSSKYDYYYCYTSTRPFVKERFLQLANMGYKRIIVVNMFINESEEYRKALLDIDELALFELGIKVTVTYPMWSSRWISKMYVHRVNSLISGSELMDTGIILLGDGTKNKNEQVILLNNIKQNLIVEGYRKSNVKISWLGSDVSAIREVTETLLNEGIRHLCYVSCCFTSENFLTQDVLIKMTNKVSRTSKIHTSYLGAWNDDDMIIRSIIDMLNSVI